jgi:hypothetical protein
MKYSYPLSVLMISKLAVSSITLYVSFFISFRLKVIVDPVNKLLKSLKVVLPSLKTFNLITGSVLFCFIKKFIPVPFQNYNHKPPAQA